MWHSPVSDDRSVVGGENLEAIAELLGELQQKGHFASRTPQ
jgi:hypothetical protein